jgi:hypothetical protein
MTMAISLFDASIPNYLQTLEATGGFLEKALAHFKANGIDAEEILEFRLAPDMLPFRYQVQSVPFHSQNAVEAIKTGALHLPGERPVHDYAGLQAMIAESVEALRKITPAEINEREGAEVVFHVGEAKRVFTAEGFLMSFSLPNLHFHATTAYDILRLKGAPLGKRDFMGAIRLKG